MIFSSASAKSFCRTCSWSRRAASSAASLTRFLRSRPRGRRRRRHLGEVDVRTERHLARVHLQDRLAAAPVGQVDDDAPVEAAGPQQAPVEHVRLVRRGEHDHALAPLKPSISVGSG
jgi:hypothetical protein